MYPRGKMRSELEYSLYQLRNGKSKYVLVNTERMDVCERSENSENPSIIYSTMDKEVRNLIIGL